jgi:probable HAF family extracellular repeat protein
VYADGTFATFDIFPSVGANEQSARGINDVGQIVGYYSGNGIPNTGFLYDSRDGSVTSFRAPFDGTTATYGNGLNNNGQIVGSYTDSISGHGFFVDAVGSFISLDVPSSVGTTALGINDAGQIVGVFHDVNDNQHGFVYDSSALSYTVIDAPFSGTTSTVVQGINNSGQLVGFYNTDNPNAPHGFFVDADGSFTSVDVPLALRTVAQGISDGGQITGYYRDGRTGLTHGFLASPYQPPAYTVRDLGPICSDAVVGCGLYKINNNGAVSGNFGPDALLVTDSSRTFLWYGPANDVNDLGKVAGLTNGHAVRWDGGGVVDLGLGVGNGINNSSQVVGSSNDHAVLWGPDGTVAVLRGIGTGDSTGFDINDNGHIVGTSRAVPGSTYRAVEWMNANAGPIVLLDLGSGPSFALAINAADQIVGSSRGRAVMWSHGVPHDIDPSAGAGAVARDVNDPGWAVGDDQLGFAFVFDGLTTHDLNALIVGDNPFSQLVAAWGINNQGQIVGVGQVPDGEERVFLATPIQIPSNLQGAKVRAFVTQFP